MFRHFRICLIILTAAVILNGCVLERIFRVKNQLCDFEKNFQIDISGGFRILLKDPVMFDEDITWLAGAEPSKQEIAGDELIMTYIAERNGMHIPGQYDLPIELRFVRLDGKYRLKEASLSKNLADILTDELLSQLMQSICKSKKSLVKQQVTIDIRKLDRKFLPIRSEILDLLGPPNPKPPLARKLVYDYQLKNNAAPGTETLIEITLDDTNETILGIRVKYLRYNLDADFVKGVAVLKVDIFIEEQT
ncbi:hypothetical protein JY97_03780 [Alkalispirochaeta odontotermitis]|nr:hypothetical protein JY97_03780 [Alkalispirochaeta odontotermitis]